MFRVPWGMITDWSLWMASTLRRFSSVNQVQHRLQTLMASNPPLPSHRQPRSRCANLLRSSLVTNSRWSGLGGFWRRSGTGVPRRRQHTVHRHIPRYALFQLSTWQPVGPGLLQSNRHQHRAPCAKVVVVRFGAGVWPVKRCDVDNQTSIESTEQLQS